VIVGGGAAGLSLALHLAHSELRDASILLIEPEPDGIDNRSWAYWTDQPPYFDGITHRSWRTLRVVLADFETTLSTGGYQYALIQGGDLHRYAAGRLAAAPNVSIVADRAKRIVDGADLAIVCADRGDYQARWVFDSRFSLQMFLPDPEHWHTLYQQFLGWDIESTEDVFDPLVPTLMDFRTPQAGSTRFVYILPFTSRRALIEHVACGPSRPEPAGQAAALREYIGSVLGDPEYAIVRCEAGVSPLSDWSFPRRTGRRIMTIGLAGGRIKASTGYAFQRIQRDSAAIVQSLIHNGHPFDVPADSVRHRRYDAALLETMTRYPEGVPIIFGALFARNPLDRIFRFLDESSSPWDEARLAATLPAWFWMKTLDRRHTGAGACLSVRR
jgi:lycopene beta-cyclase